MRDEIAAEVLTRGVAARGTFKNHYDSDELDASLLITALVGFLPPEDERVRRTVLTIERELSAGGLVLRRRTQLDEPIVGEAVTVCSWWLVAALTTIGELERARGLAERLLAYGGRLGLYAEHIDPHSGRQLGNFPHALTHLAPIDALLRLMRRRPAMTAPPFFGDHCPRGDDRDDAHAGGRAVAFERSGRALACCCAAVAVVAGEVAATYLGQARDWSASVPRQPADSLLLYASSARQRRRRDRGPSGSSSWPCTSASPPPLRTRG